MKSVVSRTSFDTEDKWIITRGNKRIGKFETGDDVYIVDTEGHYYVGTVQYVVFFKDEVGIQLNSYEFTIFCDDIEKLEVV